MKSQTKPKEMQVGSLQLVQGSREWKQMRKRCINDLYFLNSKILGLGTLIPMTPRAHGPLCLFAERKTGIEEVDTKRVQLIHVERGRGKSACITNGRTTQRLLADRDWAAGLANEKAGKACDFLANIKSNFQHNDIIKFLFPDHIPDFRKTTWRADAIVINRTRPNPVNPSVLAAGTETAVTGVHMNEWICDDLISDEAYENARAGLWTEMEKAFRWIDRLHYLLVNFRADPITFIGTPWWPGDIYDYIQEKFGKGEETKTYEWVCHLPDGDIEELTIECKGEIAIFKHAPLKNGRAVYPEKLTVEAMEDMQKDNPQLHAAQILLIPTAGGVTAFRPEWLRTYEWTGKRQFHYHDDTQQIHFERTTDLNIIMSVDPAISKRSTAARSAIMVCASNGSHIFILEAFARRALPTELSSKILEFQKEYKCSRIIIEKAGYQMALAEILSLEAQRQGLGALPIYEYNVGGDQKKSMRITGLEPYFRKGLIFYHPRQTEFYKEYLEFSADIGNRLVDTLDALAMQKESWDQLAFLGNPDQKGGRDDWQERARKKQIQIKKHSGQRTRAWK